MSQGAEANLGGNFLEQGVALEFRQRRIPFFPWSENGDNGDMFAQQFVLLRVPYKSIYGRTSYSEFVFRKFYCQYDIRIECRSQEASGSVDEKFPYLLGNAVAVREPEVWLVVDGGGAKPEAVAWLKKNAALVKTKIIRVGSLYEARGWIREAVRMAA